MANEPLVDYYEQRASEYERIYDKPERQQDIAALKSWLAELTAGTNIFEVACGTGYWTAVAAPQATSILATDINAAPLAIATSKALGDHVTFQRADAYALPDCGRVHDAGMAHFWWSHVALADQRRFLVHLASRLATGARVLMIDNRFVAGSSTPISRIDDAGNTYQMRRLADGSEHEVLKNFPSPADLERSFDGIAADVSVLALPYYWAACAELE